MRKILLIITSLCIIMGMASCSGSGDRSLERVLSKNKIVVGLDFNLESMVNSDSEELEGFTVDYINELAKRLGVSAEFENISDDDIFKSLDKDDIDCYVNLTSPSRSQKTDYYLVKTMLRHKQSVVVRESSDIKSLADLSGRKVGIVRNSYSSSTLKEAEVLSDSLENISYYEDITSLLEALSDGTIDAAVADNVDVLFIFKTENKEGYKLLDSAIATDDYYICLERTDTALRDELDAAIESMYVDGTVKSLSEKWFGADLSE